MTFKSRSQMAREVGVCRRSLLRWEGAGLIPAAERINPTFSGYSPKAQSVIASVARAAQ